MHIDQFVLHEERVQWYLSNQPHCIKCGWPSCCSCGKNKLSCDLGKIAREPMESWLKGHQYRDLLHFGMLNCFRPNGGYFRGKHNPSTLGVHYYVTRKSWWEWYLLSLGMPWLVTHSHPYICTWFAFGRRTLMILWGMWDWNLVYISGFFFLLNSFFSKHEGLDNLTMLREEQNWKGGWIWCD